MITSVNDITANSIKTILENAPISTKQRSISIPIVKRYYALLQNGSKAPAIKVCENIIVDGNHRYIAGMLLGTPPEISPASTSSVWKETPIIEWCNVNYVLEDWG